MSNTLETDILLFLMQHHHGCENAITLAKIAEHFSAICGKRISKRLVEKCCERLRKQGIAVISYSDRKGGGIFHAATFEEFVHWDLQNQSRIQKISHNAKMVRDAIYSRFRADSVPVKMSL